MVCGYAGDADVYGIFSFIWLVLGMPKSPKDQFVED